ncbi:MAG: ATP-binding protein [candidate division WOR-3 bacterium]
MATDSTAEVAPAAYASTLEWLEGKRRVVDILRQLDGRCGGEDWRSRRARPVDREARSVAFLLTKEQHRQRMEATRRAGVTLPIDRFIAEQGLDAVEREVVELLLVAETSLLRREERGIDVSDIVRLLALDSGRGVQDFLPYFLPGSHLLGVVTVRNAFGGKALSISDSMVATLLGMNELVAEDEAVPNATSESGVGDIGGFLFRSGVVLDAPTLEAVRSAWGYIHRIDVIREKWGFGSLRQMSAGLCLLFHGPSGTGKTLTALTLCRALRREPLVVNYAQLVSKWVGETEKHTKAAFAEAAREGKVLVFDECDAVFARRTDVRNSADRFANGEVNVLLMELERFSGIVILTTNHAEVLDPALERRIRHKVHFGPPDAAGRGAMWRVHLPKQAPLADDVDLDRLAEMFKLTGGQIANAVLTAASLAASRLEADSTEGLITMADFEAAVRRELQGCAGTSKGGQLGF